MQWPRLTIIRAGPGPVLQGQPHRAQGQKGPIFLNEVYDLSNFFPWPKDRAHNTVLHSPPSAMSPNSLLSLLRSVISTLSSPDSHFSQFSAESALLCLPNSLVSQLSVFLILSSPNSVFQLSAFSILSSPNFNPSLLSLC